MGREERPPDDAYYEPIRSPLLSEGDIFKDVPRVYPGVAEQITTEPDGQRRILLSGPLEPGFAMLVTPSCSMGGRLHSRPDGTLEARDYDHPVRSLVPVVPISLLGFLTNAQLGLARKYDALINYMFLPAHRQSEMPASLALLYMPITLSHDLLMTTATRTVQLALSGAQQFRRKQVALAGAIELDRRVFQPPRD